MARTWTPSQEVAINLRGKTLLVSAAAGSGKTSVLTERIIRSLIDPDPSNAADLSRMLIVTFTRAAAAELKSRIAAALTEAMAAHPDNAHLSRQMLLLGSAQISTIDSFFQKAVRANFEQLSLPASFRLADDSELLPLRTEILNSLLEEYYRKYDEPQEGTSPLERLRHNHFAYAMDHLMSDRSDGKLEAFLLDFPRFYASDPSGVEILKKCADDLRTHATYEFLSTPHGQAIYDYLADQFQSIHTYLSSLSDYLDACPDIKAVAYGIVSYDLNYCEAVLTALQENSYERLRTVIPTFSSGRFPSLKDLKTPRMEAYQSWRNGKLKNVVKEASALVAPSQEMLTSSMYATADLVEILYEFYKEFETRLLAEKNERGILEYNDVRAMLYKLLAAPDGTPTPFADSLAAQYDAVYIDEYQDVDLLQDRIFSLIGRDHRFMVGDIKQSIYGFRGSEPSIFAHYRKSMPPYFAPHAAEATGNCVFMSENFRCDEPVIRFANRVCSFLFSACEDTVGYCEDDDLRFSKVMPQNLPTGAPAPVQIAVFDSTLTQNRVAGTDEEHVSDEPVWVAAEISRLLREGVLDDGRPILPSDIAILIRKNKQGVLFANELKKLNIPVSSTTSANLLETPLLCDLLNLLRAIDNPYRDLPLSEFLLSRLGGFTLAELSDVRDASGNEAALYDAMKSAAGNEVDFAEELRARLSSMLQFIEAQRMHAASLSADRFLRLLYQSDLLRPHADTPAALFLYEQARTCQRTAFCGLYGFLNIFTKLLEDGKLSIKGFTKPESAVSIMTVHNSKGLEFPVVFCVAASSSAQNKDSESPILYHRSLGCAAKHYNTQTGELEETPLRTVACLKMREDATEESIRTLYVALTRARERLYVTGTLTGQWSNALDSAAQIRRGDRAAILGAPNNLTWILAALQEPTDASEPTPWILKHYETESVTSGVALTPQESQSGAAERPDASTLHYTEIVARQKNFTYPTAHLRDMPTKVAASKVNTSLLDTLTNQDDDFALRTQIELMRTAPTFDMLLHAHDKPSATDIGTATHEFLEFCDFSALGKSGVEQECARLVANGFISADSATILNRQQLELFCKSDLADWIREAKNIRREQRFALFLPMEKLTENASLAQKLTGQTIFVQGSIDLLLQMKDGSLRLIDYKTDHLLQAEKSDPALLSQRMLAAHGNQLAVYARAVKELFGKYPSDIRIYSLPLGATIPLPTTEILAKV